MTGAEIKKLREATCPGNNIADSRAIFARLFAVSSGAVIKWESEERRPSGLARLKLEEMWEASKC